MDVTSELGRTTNASLQVSGVTSVLRRTTIASDLWAEIWDERRDSEACECPSSGSPSH
jgi:hypothetical protein